MALSDWPVVKVSGEYIAIRLAKAIPVMGVYPHKTWTQAVVKECSFHQNAHRAGRSPI